MNRDDARRKAFDWESVKQRFNRLAEAAVRGEELSDEQAEAVMIERARSLARVPDPVPDSDEILELMIIYFEAERFAIETKFIHEVYRVGALTPVPGGPPFLAGVTNMRGAVLAVLDFRIFFGIPSERKSQSQIVVLGDQRPEYGILVDEVREVTTLRIDDVAEAPGSIHGASRDYLLGVTADAMLVLDGEKLLTDERLYMDERE